MSSIYDEYYNQALSLQNHFHDVVDDSSHPQMQSLQREMHSLAEDFKSQKHPRSAEDRIKVIEHQLLQAREQGQKLMSYQDIENLQHQYKRLREHVREMPHY